jgi:hypothetical protein
MQAKYPCNQRFNMNFSRNNQSFYGEICLNTIQATVRNFCANFPSGMSGLWDNTLQIEAKTNIAIQHSGQPKTRPITLSMA